MKPAVTSRRIGPLVMCQLLRQCLESDTLILPEKKVELSSP